MITLLQLYLQTALKTANGDAKVRLILLKLISPQAIGSANPFTVVIAVIWKNIILEETAL